jgi:hypothetical protein
LRPGHRQKHPVVVAAHFNLFLRLAVLSIRDVAISDGDVDVFIFSCILVMGSNSIEPFHLVLSHVWFNDCGEHSSQCSVKLVAGENPALMIAQDDDVS